MTVYLFYMASPVILYFFTELFLKPYLVDRERLKKIYLVLVGISMTLMMGLRSPAIGSGDTMFYYNFWEILSESSFSQLKNYLSTVDIEGGYQISTWFLSHIFKDGQWLLFLAGLFISVSVCCFTYKNCKNPVLAIIAFNCLGLFNFVVQGLRQAIAMCICLWAIEQCKKKRIVRFIALVLTASLFHASAIVFLPVFVISYTKLNFKSLVFVGISAGVCIAVLPILFEIVNQVINDHYALNQGSEEGGIFAIYIYIAIIIFGILFVDKTDEHYAMFIYMSFVGLICMILRRSSSGIIERINHYFAFSQMAIISNSTSSIPDKKANMALNMIIFALCFAVAIHKASYSSLIPYEFFWQY